MSFGKKFMICPILPPMSDLTPFYGTVLDNYGSTEPVRDKISFNMVPYGTAGTSITASFLLKLLDKQ